MAYGNPDFDVYRLPDEHEQLRAAVRDLVEDKIAPRAAEIDRTGRVPVGRARRAGPVGLQRDPHPRGVRRRRRRLDRGRHRDRRGRPGVRVVVADPGGQQARARCRCCCAASEELKKQVLPPVAAGEAMFSYALSEREAGSDAAAMRTRAVRDGDTWVLNGTKCWISNAGVSTYYTVMAVTEPGAGARGISAFVVHKDDPGFSVGHARSASSASRARRPARSTSTTARSRPTGSSASRAPASRPRCARSTTPG